MWIGTRMHGLYRMDSRGKISKVPHLQNSPEGISSEQIRDFVEDDQGNVWFGTFDGLYEWHASTGQYRLIQILEKPRDFDPFGQTGLPPLKSWCWGSILFYPFKISRFS